MKNKKSLNKWTRFDTVIIIIAIFTILITLYPLIYVISCSLSEPNQVLAGKVTFLPKGFTTQAYEVLAYNKKFWRAMLMSVFYVVVSCIIMLVTTVSVAYPLTRHNLKFRKLLTYYLLIPMYISGGMIPSFIVTTRLGLYNTIWAIILPSVGIWNIILCRTYMASLPEELIDSAMIDGSGQMKTLLKIVLPLSKPVLAVVMIYTIVNVWNSWFGASIYLTREELFPVQLHMQKTLASVSGTSSNKALMQALPYETRAKFQEIARSADQIKYAMVVITVLPIALVYPMFQKHFTKGIMLGSLKG